MKEIVALFIQVTNLKHFQGIPFDITLMIVCEGVATDSQFPQSTTIVNMQRVAWMVITTVETVHSNRNGLKGIHLEQLHSTQFPKAVVTHSESLHLRELGQVQGVFFTIARVVGNDDFCSIQRDSSTPAIIAF